MTTGRQRLGAAGEDAAVRHLEAQGYRIVERNVHLSRYGEIDIVAMDGGVLALVEVRTRKGNRLGTPEESVTPTKKRRLLMLGQMYVQQHEWEGPWRIDFVAVRFSGSRVTDVRLYRNAVVMGLDG